jgi:hypothetical protein
MRGTLVVVDLVGLSGVAYGLELAGRAPHRRHRIPRSLLALCLLYCPTEANGRVCPIADMPDSQLLLCNIGI